MKIRDVSFYVEVTGRGDPLLLMHGGPGLDHWSLTTFRRLADRHTVVSYDYRCNGRSTGAPVTPMTWESLTADADALREGLGFERWAVLNPHSERPAETLAAVADFLAVAPGLAAAPARDAAVMAPAPAQARA